MPLGLVPGYPLVSPLEVVLKMGLLKYFLEIITTELLAECGSLPYPLKIAKLLTFPFVTVAGRGTGIDSRDHRTR